MVNLSPEDPPAVVEVRYVGRNKKPIEFQDPTVYVSYQVRIASGELSMTMRMEARQFDTKVDAQKIKIIDNRTLYDREREADPLSPPSFLRVQFNSPVERDFLARECKETDTYGD